MYPCSVPALRADALFASALQRSDEVNVGQIHQAIAVSLAAGAADREQRRRTSPAPAAELAQVQAVGFPGQAAVPGQVPGKGEPLGIGEGRLDGDERGGRVMVVMGTSRVKAEGASCRPGRSRASWRTTRTTGAGRQHQFPRQSLRSLASRGDVRQSARDMSEYSSAEPRRRVPAESPCSSRNIPAQTTPIRARKGQPDGRSGTRPERISHVARLRSRHRM